MSKEQLLVRDLMTVGVQSCSQEMSIVELTRFLLDHDLEGVAVLDEEGHAVGVITRDDLVRVYADGNHATLTAADIMTEGVPQIPPDIPLPAAAQLMRDQGLRIVFLMHNSGGIIYPAAMLSYKHFLRHLIAETDEDIKDLGIKAERESPIETFIRKRDAARRRANPREE